MKLPKDGNNSNAWKTRTITRQFISYYCLIPSLNLLRCNPLTAEYNKPLQQEMDAVELRSNSVSYSVGFSKTRG